MEEKLVKPVSCLRVPRSTDQELERAAQRLSLPKAHVMRLAIIAGLPIVMKGVPQPQPMTEGGVP